jgi:hypothetical protein
MLSLPTISLNDIWDCFEILLHIKADMMSRPPNKACILDVMILKATNQKNPFC